MIEWVFALVLSIFGVIGYGITAWKASNRPVLTKISEAQGFFTNELARVEKDFTEKIAQQEKHIDKSLDAYHETVTNEINGWGKRIEDHHADINRHEAALGDQAGRLIRSEADRENLNRRMIELSVKVDKNTEETRELERSFTRQLGETERRIVSAIEGKRRTT